jgi:hypothetical protein
MASIIPTADTCVNSGRGFCYSAHSKQKPFSYFENSSPLARNHSQKSTGQDEKKNGFLNLGGRFCRGEGGFRTPLRW